MSTAGRTDEPGLDPEVALYEALGERDQVQDAADQLADAIARLLGVDIGEHSNMNDPWTNALNAAAEHQARLAAEPKETP